jgi:hypothetical protein
MGQAGQMLNIEKGKKWPPQTPNLLFQGTVSLEIGVGNAYRNFRYLKQDFLYIYYYIIIFVDYSFAQCCQTIPF